MRKQLCSMIFTVALSATFLALGTPALAAPPTLLYSDLTWGPKTGWNNTGQKGAAVTIWGRNFGPAAGSSTVTVAGAVIPADCTALIAEWGVTGVARGDQRITFFVPPTAADGAGTISVTVGGVASNSLPFEVAPANIYYVDGTNGNNANNGRTTATAYRTLVRLNPCAGPDSGHSAGVCNPDGDGQYIGYVRGGNYGASHLDVNSTSWTGYIVMSIPFGGPAARKAIVGYPGETPVFDGNQASLVVVTNDRGWSYGGHYLTIAKLTTTGSHQIWNVFGDHNRIVGNTLNRITEPWSGAIHVMNSKYTTILGNYFNNCGNTNYEHNIYIKTEPWAMSTTYDQSVLYNEVGYNEFYNPVIDRQGGVIFLSRASDQASQYVHDYTYIYGNYFHEGNADWFYVGDSVTLGNHLYYYNNVFGPNTNSSSGLTCYYGSYTQYFYNNTFYQDGATGAGNLDVEYTAAPVVRNNIFSSRSGQPAFDLSNRSSGSLNSQYDLFHNTSVPVSGNGLTISNARSGNPLFVNPAAGNYGIQAGSPAIGQGTNLYSAMSALPRGIYDYEGKTRPSAGSWDIGAVQYSAGSGNMTPPAAPTNFRILP